MQGNAPDEEHEDPHGECTHEIHRLKAALEKLQDATAPFLQAAEVIAERPQDYQDRIAMVGGLGTACDLTKAHFNRLLEATKQ